jgi:hypothetical protein
MLNTLSHSFTFYLKIPMKKYLFIPIIILLLSCSGKEIQLAKADRTIVSEITDLSPVYFFFENKGNDTLAVLNRNNTISSTNWIFHIDKRLKLKHFIPELVKLQTKKKNSPHKRADAENYFSYTDSVQKKLAFLPFTTTEFVFDNELSRFYIVKKNKEFEKFYNFNINFDKQNNVYLDGFEIDRNDFVALINQQISFANTTMKPTLIHLNFDENLTLEQYSQNKILALQLNTSLVKIADKEFIYNVKRLPKCDCK